MLKKRIEFRDTMIQKNRLSFKTIWFVEDEGYLCVSAVQDTERNLDETMIFRCDENGNIEDWSELYLHFGYLSTDEQHWKIIDDWADTRNLI